MKTTTIPPLRVSPALRREAESVLTDGETLSSFMLDALQKSIVQRRDQQAFVAHGIASREKARRTGKYVSATAVLDKLAARRTRAASRQTR